MDSEMMENVEEIIGKNFARIIKISYAIGIKNYTSPGYLISYHVHNPEKELVSPNSPYIKICSMLDSKRIPPKLSSNGMPPKRVPISKINIKDIYWIEVLDYSVFHEPKPLASSEPFASSDIVEVCLKHDFNEPDITWLFTLDDKENIKKSLEKITKMTSSKYPSFTFHDKNYLVVLEKFS